MPDAGTGRRETAGAEPARVRSLARVRSRVQFQVGQRSEGFLADIARERPLARVDPSVIFAVDDHLPALLALEFLPLSDRRRFAAVVGFLVRMRRDLVGQ